MALHSITIAPENVRAESQPGVLPAWLDEIAEYVRQAASEGAPVTLTAKRRMLTPGQVADAIGVSRSTISRKIAAGELHAVKIGNRNRIPYEEFQRFWQQIRGEVVSMTSDDISADLFGER